MERRTFIEKLCMLGCSATFVSHLSGCSTTKDSIRFGLLTDIHFARREKAGNRYYSSSIDKVEIAIKEFNSQDLDFMIELGDLKDQGVKPNKEETLSFLNEIEKKLQTFNGDVYHVLGNHDMDSISKKDYLTHTSNPGAANEKKYYSFKKKGVKFIVLDANYREDQSDYDCGNFNWEEAVIPNHEIEWLKNELTEGKEPVIIFTHQLLDVNSGVYKGLYIRNAEQINQILIDSKRVLAVFQGHHHAGSYSLSNNIHYFTMSGIIEGDLPHDNTFAIVEILPNRNIEIKGFYNCQDRILPNII